MPPESFVYCPDCGGRVLRSDECEACGAALPDDLPEADEVDADVAGDMAYDLERERSLER